MSRTAGQLIDETLGLLAGHARSPQITTLTTGISPTDLTMMITPVRATAAGLGLGVVEIDQELIYVTDVDESSGTVTVAPWGRGHLGTTAASHSANAKVTSQPTFPRAWVLQRINEAIERVYPDVFAISSVELTTTVPSITYTLPVGAERVLIARWQTPTASQEWITVRRWRMQPGGGTLTGDSGRSVDVHDAMQPGRPIQFLVASQPSPLVNETDDFVTTTGLKAGLADVITLGAASRLLLSDEAARARINTIEQQNKSGSIPGQTALTASRYFESQFKTRLAEERLELQRLYPARITREWA